MKIVKMGFIKCVIAMVLIVMASACSDVKQGQEVKSGPLPDNPENRLVEAKRMIEVMPPQPIAPRAGA